MREEARSGFGDCLLTANKKSNERTDLPLLYNHHQTMQTMR
ncbi:hypothetical protein C2W59_00424 [Bacillus pumilus]|uniref:Uncharacterized protein n=1 Tax=Bacillus pumilus TaxID=1408 RepID=A0AB34QVN5_BACPU|nr:hypothetical protein [Bacillus pumilus]KIL20573.1 hypothetical protein B4127_2856 [Bacillus pumilus]RAP14225.1 hypothetical protein C2W58_02323 [Bacillus pumilus]RAP25461.1 hypothetical protein C2W59_00424 [Bacillus pumilus]